MHKFIKIFGCFVLAVMLMGAEDKCPVKPLPVPTPTPSPTPTPTPTPEPTPTPTPEPTPTPTPTPVPTPTPDPQTCPLLTFLKMDIKNLSGKVIDVTPQGPDKARCLTIGKNQDKCPLGPEGPNPEDNAVRIACETFYGPYEFSIDGHLCTADTRDSLGCWHHNDNPLQVKVTRNGDVQVVAKKTGLTNHVSVVF